MIPSPSDPIGAADTADGLRAAGPEAFLDRADGILDIAGSTVAPLERLDARGSLAGGVFGDAAEIGLIVERTNLCVAADDPAGPRRVS